MQFFCKFRIQFASAHVEARHERTRHGIESSVNDRGVRLRTSARDIVFFFDERDLCGSFCKLPRDAGAGNPRADYRNVIHNHAIHDASSKHNYYQLSAASKNRSFQAAGKIINKLKNY